MVSITRFTNKQLIGKTAVTDFGSGRIVEAHGSGSQRTIIIEHPNKMREQFSAFRIKEIENDNNLPKRFR